MKHEDLLNGKEDGKTAWDTEPVSRGGHIAQVLSALFLIVAILFSMVVVIQTATTGYVSIGGYSVFRVVTGSMEPTIPVGAVLLNQKTDIETVQPGDIVCYKARIGQIGGAVITHRVIHVGSDERGVYLETRGDANVVSDGTYVREENLIGRVVWYSGEESGVAKIAAFFSGRIGFLACVVFPVLLIAGLILQNAVKNIYKELREVQARERDPGPPKDPPLPGYKYLTKADYEEIYQKLKEEFLDK